MIKKLTPLVLAACFMLSSCYTVTKVGDTSKRTLGGLFYALPQTQICIDVTYQYFNLDEAVYSEYASEMLALDNFDAERPYRIQSVEASYSVSADPDQFYLVTPYGISVQVDSRHLLRSVGLTPQAAASQMGPAQSVNQSPENLSKLTLHNATADRMLPRYNLYDRTDTFYVRGDRPGHPSKTATRKSPRSLRQRAQAAAEEIAELEDERADIAASDRMTPEGREQALKELEAQEALLMAQFVGKSVVETAHFYLTPRAYSKNSDTLMVQTLFYFSRSEGICDSDDVGAMPVVCTLRPDQSLQRVRRFSRRRSAEARQSWIDVFNRSFKYRLPSDAQVTVSCELFDYQATLPIAQFGPIVDLPHKRFKALFDVNTGALIYYEN